jgi:hypothetical protein
MASRKSRSPSIIAEMVGVVVALVVTCAIAGFLWVSVLTTLASTGLIRGPRDPGPRTAMEAWLVHGWPLLLMVELLVGALVAKRVCRGFFRSKPGRLLPNKTQQPTGAPSGAGG